MFCRPAAVLFSLAFLITGCQSKTAPPSPVRFAVLRFENLTGDPSLEWTARAASLILSQSLAQSLGGPVLTSDGVGRAEAAVGAHLSTAPGLSSEREAATAAGATQLISGYVTRSPAGFRIAASDGARILAGRGSGVIEALADLAKQFSPGAKPPDTRSTEALRLCSMAVEAPRDSSVALLRAAVAADENFGTASTLLVRSLVAAGDASAQAAIEEGGRHNLSALDKANLNFESASLSGDMPGKLRALRTIANASPGDADLPRTLAQTEMAAGQFAEAARDWQKLAASNPSDADAWNQLGYARAWSEDFNGAVAAMKEYGKLRPADPNSMDSLGDAQFLYRRFGDAAASYRKAASLDPKFQNGGDFYKAAWATFRGGNRNEADALFAQFRTARGKANIDTTLLAADWFYRTGRTSEAMDLLRPEAAKTESPNLRLAAFAQLAVWDLLEGDRPAAGRDAAAAGQPASAGVLAVRFAALPSASAEEWRQRSERIINAPQAENLRTMALAYALLLDGKRDAAMPYWTRIVAAAPGTDFFSRTILAKLEGKPQPLEILPDPNALNEFAAIPDKL